jgi:hypothetical protein
VDLTFLLLLLFLPPFLFLLLLVFLSFVLTRTHKFPYLRIAWPSDIILGSTLRFLSIPITQVRLNEEAREYHATIWGSTGSGKSFLLLNIFVQNFLKGNGVGLIDPHNDLSIDILKQLIHRGVFQNQKTYRKLVYIDWGNKLITPFNILAGADDDKYKDDMLDTHPTAVTNRVLHMAQRVWPELESSAPTFKEYFRSAMKVLIANNLPLGYIHQFFTDPELRKACLPKVKDPEDIRKWQFIDDPRTKPAEQLSEIGSSRRRADDLLYDPIAKFAFKSPENVIRHREWMDNRVAFIHNVGKLSPETRQIIGALLLVDIEQSLMSRMDLDYNDRPPCTILVDEWQLFADQEQTITHTLSETRKFGGRLYLATQSLGVIGTNRLQGALEQCNLNIAMKLGNDSAQRQAPQIAHYDFGQIKEEAKNETQHNLFTGVFEQTQQWTEELKHLKKRFAYVKIAAKPPVRIETATVPKPKIRKSQLDEVLVTYRSMYQQTVPQAQERMSQIQLPTAAVADSRPVHTKLYKSKK